MDDDIIARMRKEEAELSRKLRAVRDLLAAYGADTSSQAVPISRPAEVRTSESGRSTPREKVGVEGFGSYGRTVVVEAMRFLQGADRLLKTREIVAHLEELGIELRGESKVNAVGALLSRSTDIMSHGKAGWALANPDMARTIVAQNGHKENGASGEPPNAPDVAEEDVPPPSSAKSYSYPWARA